MKCILADRLYVPEECVTPEHLDGFVYQIGEMDGGYDYGPFESVVGSLRTFSKVRVNGAIYYAFSRGNLSKIGELFGDLPWEDKTSAPPMTYDLQFKGALHTWESKQIGQQEAVATWLKYKSGIVKAPPRFGKTISSIFILTKLKKKTLIVAHQVDLLEQYYNSFVKFTNIDDVRHVNPKQKARDATGRVVGFFQDYDNPEELDVCLLCWQTLASKKNGAERLLKYGSAWGTVIVDECHPYDTAVLVDYDKYMSIGEIYENPNITHVLSYDLESKKIEKKRIIERRCNESDKPRVAIRIKGDRGLAVVSPTENHKYYVVGKGYIEAKDLTSGDKLITYAGDIFKATYCKVEGCYELFTATNENPASISGSITHHMAEKHGATTFSTLKKCALCDYQGFSLTTHYLMAHDSEAFAERNKKVASKRKQFLWSEEGASHRKFYSDRMLSNNPMKDRDITQKVGEHVSQSFWNKSIEEQDKQVTRFQNAPKRTSMPTKREQELIDLKIPNLIYTGKGTYYVTLLLEGKKRKKNPDFINATEDDTPTKVIEIMDYEYWHSESEIAPLVTAYKEVGIECLILDAKIPLEEMRSKIESFINNHYVEVVAVTKIVAALKDRRVYNLEVEGNHNYFVVAKKLHNGRVKKTPTIPVLVSNCHKVGGTCYARTVNRLSARYRLGLTGTVERVDGREFLLHDIIGPVVAEGRVATIPCSVVVTHTGIPIKYSFTEPLPYLYKRLYNNKDRMEAILTDLEKDVEAGRYICFAFHRCSVAQLCHWTDKLKGLGIKAESFYGSCKDREGVLERARSGETQVLVCNSQMLTGIDVPRWNVYYSAFPTSNIVFNEDGKLSGNFYQEFSRIRTPFTYEDGTVKTEGIIRDYVDNNSLCFGMYKKRYRAYTNQQFKIAIVKLEQKTALTLE